MLKRDFLRSAVALWTTPVLAALSNAELMARNASTASVFLPALSRVRYFRSREWRRDLMPRLWAFLRALLRMRRSADLVFGIKAFAVFESERETVAERSPLSTANRMPNRMGR